MKFHVLKEDFIKSLQTVQHSVSSRSVMPILSGVKINTGDDLVSLFATDLESSTMTICSANIEEPGQCVVSHKILFELFKDLRDEKVSLEAAGNELQVTGENNNFKIFTMPSDEFPSMPIVDVLVVEKLNPPSFTKSIQVVSKAASKDEKRPTLTGVYMEIEEDEIRLVSTDSYRLAVKKIKNGFKTVEKGSFIIPANALANFSRIVNDENPIDIYRDENAGQLRFDNQSVSFTIRLIEGKFPRYEQFIPESTDKVMESDKDKILSAIKRVSLVNTTLRLEIDGGRLIVNSESKDVGEGKETLDVLYEGDPISIAFNSKFLEDGISSVEGETVLIGITEPLKPGVIRGKEEESFTYIIMPIRI